MEEEIDCLEGKQVDIVNVSPLSTVGDADGEELTTFFFININLEK
jgi:hypothetical protein